MTDNLFDEATHRRGPECVDTPFDSEYQVFFAAWSWTPLEDGRTIWVNYRLWQAEVWLPSPDGDIPGFIPYEQPPWKPETDPEKTVPIMDGHRVWDGSAQWTMKENNWDSNGAEELEALFRAIRRTHIIAAEIMGDAWEDGEPK